MAGRIDFVPGAQVTDKVEPEPKELDQEEMQRRFLDHLREVAHYWADLDVLRSGYDPETEGCTFARYQLEGFVHSLLVMFDGGSMGLPAFHIVPSPHGTDKDHYRDQGQNWWPDAELPSGMKTVEGNDMLHDLWNEFRRGDRFQPKPTHVIQTDRLPIEVFLNDSNPYVIAPVEDPGLVEDSLPKGWTVGHSWWNSNPNQQRPDGRWKLFLWRDEDMANYGAFGDRNGLPLKAPLEVIQGGRDAK